MGGIKMPIISPCSGGGLHSRTLKSLASDVDILSYQQGSIPKKAYCRVNQMRNVQKASHPRAVTSSSGKSPSTEELRWRNDCGGGVSLPPHTACWWGLTVTSRCPSFRSRGSSPIESPPMVSPFPSTRPAGEEKKKLWREDCFHLCLPIAPS